MADRRLEPKFLKSRIHALSPVSCCLFLDFFAFPALHAGSALPMLLRGKTHVCKHTSRNSRLLGLCLSLSLRKPTWFFSSDSDAIKRLTWLLSTQNSKRFANVYFIITNKSLASCLTADGDTVMIEWIELWRQTSSIGVQGSPGTNSEF